MQMTWFEVFLLVICVILIVLPPRYDPAIRWKEYNEAWAKRLQENRKK